MKIFNSRQCQQITQLEIYNENLKVLLDDTFIYLNYLEFLSLDSLQITTIQPGAFNGMSHVFELDFTDNLMPSVPKDMLAHLTGLEVLVLANNGITKLPIGFFDNCPLISNILINENLQQYCKTAFNNLNELQDLDLQGNPCVGAIQIFDFNYYPNYNYMIEDPWWKPHNRLVCIAH